MRLRSLRMLAMPRMYFLHCCVVLSIFIYSYILHLLFDLLLTLMSFYILYVRYILLLTVMYMFAVAFPLIVALIQKKNHFVMCHASSVTHLCQSKDVKI